MPLAGRRGLHRAASLRTSRQGVGFAGLRARQCSHVCICELHLCCLQCCVCGLIKAIPPRVQLLLTTVTASMPAGGLSQPAAKRARSGSPAATPAFAQPPPAVSTPPLAQSDAHGGDVDGDDDDDAPAATVQQLFTWVRGPAVQSQSVSSSCPTPLTLQQAQHQASAVHEIGSAGPDQPLHHAGRCCSLLPSCSYAQVECCSCGMWRQVPASADLVEHDDIWGSCSDASFSTAAQPLWLQATHTLLAPAGGVLQLRKVAPGADLGEDDDIWVCGMQGAGRSCSDACVDSAA